MNVKRVRTPKLEYLLLNFHYEFTTHLLASNIEYDVT